MIFMKEINVICDIDSGLEHRKGERGEGNKGRSKEGIEGKKERSKEGKKQRRKEAKKERRKEGNNYNHFRRNHFQPRPSVSPSQVLGRVYQPHRVWYHLRMISRF